jgi:adenosylcobinamide amidohydrolase
VSATVDKDYAHPDPPDHLRSVADAHELAGEGIGFLTAVDVREAVWAEDDGVEVLATVGLGWPTWAAAPDDAPDSPVAGTINLLVWVPVRLADGALVNAVATATEAKAQALAEQHVPGTGTASDAVAVCCPLNGPREAYGGPRSTWGARLARAVYAAVTTGAARR